MMGSITGSSLVNSALAGVNMVNADNNGLNGLAQKQLDNSLSKMNDALKGAKIIRVGDIKGGSALSQLSVDDMVAQGYTVIGLNGQVIKAPQQQQPMAAGGSMGTAGYSNFSMSPIQGWAGAGAVPQYGWVNGTIQPYANYLDQTNGMGMFFPPTANINQGYGMNQGYPMMAGGNSMLNSIDAQIMMLQAQRAMYAGGGNMMGGMLPSASATPVGKQTLQDLKVNGSASTAGAGGMTPQQQQMMMMQNMGMYSSPLMQNVALPQFTPTANASATPDLASIMALLQQSGVDISTLGMGTGAATTTTTADTTALTYINTPVTDTTAA
jgi:hypothetical protein